VLSKIPCEITAGWAKNLCTQFEGPFFEELIAEVDREDRD